ncbi:MAG: peptidoglycan DD-metalloendopeptidase family protein [Deltaproteobacteria bacterium]|nr:peptidoglycan DD-metalloendopeptidase family protein [Deltaproteobacteria bacterium]
MTLLPLLAGLVLGLHPAEPEAATDPLPPLHPGAGRDTELRLLMEVLDILQEDVDRLEKAKAKLAERHSRLMSRVGEVEVRLAALDERVEAQRAAARTLVRAAVRLREPSDWQILVSSGRYHDLLVYRRTIGRLLERIHRRMEEIKEKKARWQQLHREARRELEDMRRLEDDAGQALAEVTQRLQEKKDELRERERKIAAVSSLFLMVAVRREAVLPGGEVPGIQAVEAPGETPEAVASLPPADESNWRKRDREFPLPLSPGRIYKGFDRQVSDDLGTEKMTRGWVLTPHAEKGGSATPAKAEIRAPAPGVVSYVGHIPGFGMTLILEHGEDYHTVYANLYKVAVDKGGTVTGGEVLGLIKSLRPGVPPYLYFEVRERRLAVDPRPWFHLRPLKQP